MADKRDLTQGTVQYQLIRLASPLVLGIIALISVSIVDAYFLGQLGMVPLAAISFAFPVSFSIASLSIGLSAGTGSVISRAIGAKDENRVKRLATDSLVLALLLSLGVGLVGYLTIRPLFALIGAEGQVLEQIVPYMQIWYFSLPLLVVAQVGSNILRANGDTLIPAAVMILSAVTNMALDPIFILGGFGIEGMGMEGAAWATFIGRGVMPLIILPVLIFREQILTLARPALSAVVSSWKEILSIGVPAAFGNAVNPVGISIATAMIAGYGNDTVAAFGVAARLESFASIPMLALSGSIGPLAGQNWGAREFERVREGIRFAFLICLGWSLFTAAIFAVAGGWMADQFSDNADIGREAALYLWIVPATLAGYGVTIVSAGAFNALGRPMRGLGLYLIRTAMLYVPLVGIATLFFGVIGVFAAIAAANVLSGIIVFWLTRRWVGNMIAQQKIA